MSAILAGLRFWTTRPVQQGDHEPAELRQMKRNAILINVARGGVVDTEALTEMLEQGLIHGAGLDVTEPEPLPRDHRLLKMPNVVITPHLGGCTYRSLRDARLFAGRKLVHYLKTGEELRMDRGCSPLGSCEYAADGNKG